MGTNVSHFDYCSLSCFSSSGTGNLQRLGAKMNSIKYQEILLKKITLQMLKWVALYFSASVNLGVGITWCFCEAKWDRDAHSSENKNLDM